MGFIVKIFSIILFFFSILVSAQTPLTIERTASDVILAVAADTSSPVNETSVIYPFYYAGGAIIEFEKTFLTDYASYDSLKHFIFGLQDEFKNITNDSALVLLNQYYLRINSTFYNYFKSKFFASAKTKIIFFSASVSCPCTLEMCKKQLIDILKLRKEQSGIFDFWVIDSYWNNELQIKYDAYFAPSVLVLNGDNEVIKKIEYDEQMIDRLKNFLAENDKGDN